MGEVELDDSKGILKVHAEIIFYGNAANEILSNQIANDIESQWNEPSASVSIHNKWYKVQFKVAGYHATGLQPINVYENVDPRKNYFRIEEFASGNISFVDGINSNTGYFKLDNLLNNSTTAAHEFGHTIGLEHPTIMDIRGVGVPGIMYPRGTIVDPPYQYDPSARPLAPGGTMNPFTRKVLIGDIDDLKLHRLSYNNGLAILGDFTSVWHEAHQP
ncbi:MAG: peptidase M10 [Ferruginibacter sp.]